MYCKFYESMWKNEDSWKRKMHEILMEQFSNCQTEEEINSIVDHEIETCWQLTGLSFDEFDVATEAFENIIENK